MVSFSQLPESRDPRALFGSLFELTEQCRELEGAVAGKFSSGGLGYEIPRFHFAGPYAGHDPIQLGLFAGVHGDEPAGCVALAQFLAALAADPARGAGYELWVYPLVNPTGYEAGTRENRTGRDLNREFWRGSTQPEVRLIEAELRDRRFDGIITLHADDTCEGLYGYSHGRSLDENLLKPALAAAERVIPRDPRSVIDGFAAKDGVICDCFQGVLSAPPEQKPRPFDLIFETPARSPVKDQVFAAVAALDEILARYRGFIAHAQYL